MHAAVAELIDNSWDAAVARVDGRSGARITRPALEPLETARTESVFGDEFPVLAHLRAALDLARNGELAGLAETFAAAVDAIRWTQNAAYDETRVGRELLDNYAYACLSGPDGPQACEAPLGGYILLAPHMEYARHRHAPREIYLLLTPGARWSLDGGEWFEVEAGELIVHEPWQMHAMRTGDEPLLAFAAWLERGDRGAIEI
jgi:hypothetical protein